MPQLITTKPGDKYASIRNPRVYEALRKQGMSKQRAARISNAQKRHKAYTLDQLERFVESAAYDPALADAIARRIPELPRLKGEQIAPGITRIRGNLCNVHGRYGKCPGASAAPVTPTKPKKGRARKPRQTPEQRAQAREQQRQTNIDAVAARMAETDTGLSPSGSKALVAFARGQQPDKVQGDGLVQMGLAERAADGSYRMTPTGRAAVSAMAAGDYQRAVDAVSRGSDAQSARQGRDQERTQRRQDAAGKRAARQMDRELAQRQRDAKRQAQQAKPKPVKAGSSGGDKRQEPGPEKPKRLAPRKRIARSQAPSVGGLSDKPRPKPAAPAKEPRPEKQETTPALAETARALSSGVELTENDTQALIRNGLARLNKDGELILTAAGQRAVRKKEQLKVQKQMREGNADHYDYSDQRRKEQNNLRGFNEAHASSISPSFRVFKDASGRYRWVAQSSTAYQDRDQEIVSTKALADDVQRADTDGSYGPLRWWHSPGLDLGDCDFNAMHGRVLIESGTFRSEAIALKVARAADRLEISLGFLHPPTEPDAAGVFHHIRRFERSLVPRGKASNRFTAFHVKEQIMEATKVAALKTLGFSDTDIADIEARASATEKAADDQQTAYKAEEPKIPPPPAIRWDGSAWVMEAEKAEKAEVEAEKALPMAEAEGVEEDAIGEMPMEEDAGEYLEDEAFIAAIATKVAEILAPQFAEIKGAMNFEKKIGDALGELKTTWGGYQTQKDASDAERMSEIATLKASLAETQAKLTELLGDRPAVGYRPSQAIDNILGQDAALLAAVKTEQSNADAFVDDRGIPLANLMFGIGGGSPPAR